MYDFLITLLGISAVLAIVSLVLYACKGILRKKFSASCRYFLWLIIVLRLCIPVTALSGQSLINIPFPQAFQSESVYATEVTLPNAENEKNEVPDNTPIVPSETGKLPNENYENELTPPPIIESGEQYVPVVPPFVGDVENPVINNAPETFPSASAMNTPTVPVIPDNGNAENESLQPYQPADGSETATRRINYFAVLVGIWAIGAIGFLTVDIVKYFAFLKEIKKSIIPADEELECIYKETVSKRNIAKAPKLYVSDAVTSPMLVGIFKPMIILPMLTLDNEAWSGIISHELTHYKRRDLWAKLASLIARSLHWFNPMAHVAVKMMNEEMELSCDEKTLKNVSEESRLKYGTVMVDILRNCKGRVNAFSTHFNPNRNTAKGRIMNILDSTKKRRGISLVCLCLVLCIVSGSVFGCVSNSKGNDEKSTENMGEEISDTKEDETNNEPTKEKIDYFYEYVRIDNIKNSDSTIFEKNADFEDLSKNDMSVYKFTTLTDFSSYIGNYTERSKYDSTLWVSNLSYYDPKSRGTKYGNRFFVDNCLIAVQTKEEADKRYVVSDLSKEGSSLDIELYPVEYESDVEGHTCQFYMIEVAKSDIRDITEFNVEVFEPTDSYDDRLYYSKEAEKVTWDYPTDKTKVERDENGVYKTVEFYTNDPTWRLYFEIGGPYLTLTNGKVAYTFDDERKNTDPTYDCMFFPTSGEQSAAAIISPDGHYAAVLYSRLRFVYGQYNSTSMRVIDLTTGQTVETNSGYYEYIFSSNRLSTKYLNSYLPIEGYTKVLFYMDTQAEFIDRDTLLIHRQLLTEDGKIRLYDRQEYNIGQPIEKDFASYGEYTGILKDDVKEKESIEYTYVEYSPNEPADSIIDWSDSTDLSGYSIKLKVPTGWEYQAGSYSLPDSSVGVDCWHVFSVEKNYIFKDDFLDYASPDRRYTEDSPHSLVTVPHNLKEWKITRGTTAQGYDYIAYGSKYYLRVTDGLVWTIEFKSGVSMEAYELKNDIINSVILVKKDVDRTVVSLDEIDRLNVDESLKSMAKALLTNDTATMEKLSRCESGTYNEYKKVKFGNYTVKVSAQNRNRLEITVDVENVPEILSFASDPDNNVLFYIELGVNGIFPTVGSEVKPNGAYYTKESAFLRSWFGTPSFDYDIKRAADIPADKLSSYSVWLYDCLYNYAKLNCFKADGSAYTDGELADMIRLYTEKVFGLTNHTGYTKVFSVNDNGEKYYSLGHGGKIAGYVIDGYKLYDENGVEINENSVTDAETTVDTATGEATMHRKVDYAYSDTFVTVYADPGCTVMSQRIKYTITMGEVFPEYFTYEIVDETGYPPYGGDQM